MSEAATRQAAREFSSRDHLSSTSPFESLLNDSIAVLEDSSDILGQSLARALELRDRHHSGRFHLAVLGQFKRGKSTFINALLQSDLLPTSVVPATAVPTFIEYGAAPLIRVIFSNGTEDVCEGTGETGVRQLREFLARYVTEKGNPENRAGVEKVIVSYPAPLISSGIVLIDTPGIGSTHTHNTEATLRFLPQCDAAFIVLSPDPPVTEVELSFFKHVSSRAAKIFVVINKKDTVLPDELDELTSFVSHVLHSKAGFAEDTQIFPVSARETLSSLQSNEERDTSGFLRLLETVSRFVALDKAEALHVALLQKLRTVLSDAAMAVDLMHASLTQPLKDVESILAELEEVQNNVRDEEMRILDSIAGDHRRLAAFLEEQAQTLRVESHKYLNEVLQNQSRTNSGIPVSMSEVRAVIGLEVPPFFERRLGEMSELFNRRIAETLAPYNARLDSLVEGVREKAAVLFGLQYAHSDRKIALEIRREPYWETHKWSSSLSPVPEGFLDPLLPKALRKRLLRKRIAQYISDIVMSNVENLRYATLLNVDETFRRFQADLKEAVVDTLNNTAGAIRMALSKRTQLAEQCAGEVSRLGFISERIHSLLNHATDA